jgi:hypothetical protein
MKKRQQKPERLPPPEFDVAVHRDVRDAREVDLIATS